MGEVVGGVKPKRPAQGWRFRLPAAQQAAGEGGGAHARRAALQWSAGALARGARDAGGADAPWRSQELWELLRDLAAAHSAGALAPAPLPAAGLLSAAGRAFASADAPAAAAEAAAAALTALAASRSLRYAFRPSTEHVVKLGEVALAKGAGEAEGKAAAALLAAHALAAPSPRKLFERFVERLLGLVMSRRDAAVALGAAQVGLVAALDLATRRVLFHRAHVPGFAVMLPAFAGPAEGGRPAKQRRRADDAGQAEGEAEGKGKGKGKGEGDAQRPKLQVDASGYQRVLFERLAAGIVSGDAAAAAGTLRLLAMYVAGGTDEDEFMNLMSAPPPGAAVMAFVSRVAEPSLAALRAADKGDTHAIETATRAADTLAAMCDIVRSAGAYSHAHALARDDGPHARCLAAISRAALTMLDAVLGTGLGLGAAKQRDTGPATIARSAAAALGVVRATLLIDHLAADSGQSTDATWGSLWLATRASLGQDVPKDIRDGLLGAAREVACGLLDTARQMRSLDDFVGGMLAATRRGSGAGPAFTGATGGGRKRGRESDGGASKEWATPEAVRALLLTPRVADALGSALRKMLGAQAPAVVAAAVDAATKIAEELADHVEGDSSWALVAAEVAAMCIDGVSVDDTNAAALKRECELLLTNIIAPVFSSACSAASGDDNADDAGPSVAALVFASRLLVAGQSLRSECIGWLSSSIDDLDAAPPGAWAALGEGSDAWPPLTELRKWVGRAHGGSAQLAFVLDCLLLHRIRSLEAAGDDAEGPGRESHELCKQLLVKNATAGADETADAALWFSAVAAKSAVILPPFTWGEYRLAHLTLIEKSASTWGAYADGKPVASVARDFISGLASGEENTALGGAVATSWLRCAEIFEVRGFRAALARELAGEIVALTEEVSNATREQLPKSRAKAIKAAVKGLKAMHKALAPKHGVDAALARGVDTFLEMDATELSEAFGADAANAQPVANAALMAILESVLALPRGFLGDGTAAAGVAAACAVSEGALRLAGCGASANAARQAGVAVLYGAVTNAKLSEAIELHFDSGKQPVQLSEGDHTLRALVVSKPFSRWLSTARAVSGGAANAISAHEGCLAAVASALAMPGAQCGALLGTVSEALKASSGGDRVQALSAAAGAMAGLAMRGGGSGDPQLRALLVAARYQQQMRRMVPTDYKLAARDATVHSEAAKIDAAVVDALDDALQEALDCGIKDATVAKGLASACRAAAAVLEWRMAHMQADVDAATPEELAQLESAGRGTVIQALPDEGPEPSDDSIASGDNSDSGESGDGAGGGSDDGAINYNELANDSDDDDIRAVAEIEPDEELTGQDKYDLGRVEADMEVDDDVDRAVESDEPPPLALRAGDAPVVARIGAHVSRVLQLLASDKEAINREARDALYAYLTAAMSMVSRVRPYPPLGAFSKLLAAHVALLGRRGTRALAESDDRDAESECIRASLLALLDSCRPSQLRLTFNALTDGLTGYNEWHKTACLACMSPALEAVSGGRARAVEKAAGRLVPALLSAARDVARPAAHGCGDASAVSVALAAFEALTALTSKRSVELGNSEAGTVLVAPGLFYLGPLPDPVTAAAALSDPIRAAACQALFSAAASAIRAALKFRRAETRRQMVLVTQSLQGMLRVLGRFAIASGRCTAESGAAACVAACAASMRGVYAEVEARKAIFSKYAPHLMADLLVHMVGTSGGAPLSALPDASAALRECGLCMLGTCGPRELQQMHATYGSQSALGVALAAMRTDFERRHKFEGKV